MKQDHFMLVVFEVLKGIKEFVLVVARLEHIAEKHYQRALVDIFGNIVQRLSHQ